MAFAIPSGQAARSTKTGRLYLNPSTVIRLLPISLLLLVLSLFPSEKVCAVPIADEQPSTPAQVIEAVNALRISSGLYPLSVHPALMQAAQIEADGIANGLPGHWRPYGLTLGQWLISLGYPLAGDLYQDGYRSENWIAARSVEEAIKAWKGDGEHSNTMLSPDRSDMGVGIAVGDQVIIVLTTALQTSSGKMQSAAYPLLTQIAGGSIAGASSVSQYMKPVVLSTARPNGDVVHKLQYGQALWTIAIAYHTTIDQIRAWNNLGQETTVYEGQYLLVQRSATQPPPATSTPTASSTPFNTTTPPPPSGTQRTQPPTSSPTPTVLTSSTSPVENAPSQNPSLGLRVGLILVVVALGGLIGVLLTQRAN